MAGGAVRYCTPSQLNRFVVPCNRLHNSQSGSDHEARRHRVHQRGRDRPRLAVPRRMRRATSHRRPSSSPAGGATSASSSCRTTPRASPPPGSPHWCSTTATSASPTAMYASTSIRGLQIRDYQNALSYLESRDDVDAERLGAWGISYSGGHVLILAAIDPRVQAIVSQIPVIDGYRNMRRVHGTIGYRKLWDLILEDRRQRYARSRRPAVHPPRHRRARQRPVDVAVPRDLPRRSRRSSRATHRCTRTAAPSSPSTSCSTTTWAVRAAHLRHADIDDRRQWRRPHAVGPRDRRLQRPADGRQGVDGAPAHDAHEAVQRSGQARGRRARGHRVVHQPAARRP